MVKNRLNIQVAVLLAVAFSLFAYNPVAGQVQKYLVLFKDKAGSSFGTDRPEAFLSARSIQRRQKQGIKITQRDLPVNTNYLAAVRGTGATVIYSSRWLNAALVQATSTQLAAVRALPSFKDFWFKKDASGNPPTISRYRLNAEAKVKDKFESESTEVLNYGASNTQIQMIGADKMHEKGFSGQGILVGVFDGGFRNANVNTAMLPIFAENRVVGTFDFVKNLKNNNDIYTQDAHGANCFSIMAGFRDGALIGPAYKASFLLCRTEEVANEMPIEEANWLFAAEYADSAGVDIISSSLGYTTFDDPQFDYTYANMNGKTTLVSAAADWAAGVGMVVVTAAGNDGASAWKYICSPADADSVLAVGAVTATEITAGFSSFGPSSDGRVKPDVTAMGQATVLSSASSTTVSGNGTSYSTPLLAGMVAGFWQSQPHLSAVQVMDCIKKSGHIYSTPNDRQGYGIPNFDRAVLVSQRDYPVTAIEPNGLLRGIKLSPTLLSDSSEMCLELSSALMGNELHLVLFNMLGQVTWQKSLTATDSKHFITVPSNLLTGLYIMRIQNETQNTAIKIMKW